MIKLKLSIPKDFFQEEYRSDYNVSSEMKKVWAVQLDLFAEFDRVCQKYNIKYIASGGTMLGAVRHHGYIPWDDDMDLMMMRDQYKKLCDVASSEFSYPYFFQTAETDKGYIKGFARLRNSETTGIQKNELPYKLKFNQGIFIDIFPMDKVCDDVLKFEEQKKTFNNIRRKCTYLNIVENCIVKQNSPCIEKMLRHTLSSTIGEISSKMQWCEKAFKKGISVCSMYNDSKMEMASLLSFQIDNLNHSIRVSDLDDIILMPFEFLQMPVIANYDEHLRRKYGDYMTPQKNPNYHGDIIFDTSRSYKDFLREYSQQNR